MPRTTAVLGGSFNPPHAGHLRIALETREALGIERVLLIPCASPPHKSALNMLPFALRRAMLEATVKALPGFDVCTLEAERPGPSYTVDTLSELRTRLPGERLLFIMGAKDFLTLESWRRWEELPGLTDFAVLPRDGAEARAFHQKTCALWPTAKLLPTSEHSTLATYTIPPAAGKLLYISQPKLEISSTLVRRRFLAGRSIDFLVPAPVAELLHRHRDTVLELWKGDIPEVTL